MENLRLILEAFGYVLVEHPREFRTKPIYRESGNATSLRINKNTGNWVDFGACIGGNFLELIKLTKGLNSQEEAQEYLKKNYNLKFAPPKQKPTIKSQIIFPMQELQTLSPVHDYWIKRNISIETLREFRGGICFDGKMKRRYVFPIFDHRNALVGFAGRDTHQTPYIKWKILGQKINFDYPSFKNFDILKETREVILVESIGDGLSLWDAGIKNFLITFGIQAQRGVINTLLKINPKKIIISFNNDSDNNFIGNKSAENEKNKLSKYFNPNTIFVKMPTKKDFNEMSKDEILNWYNNETI